MFSPKFSARIGKTRIETLAFGNVFSALDQNRSRELRESNVDELGASREQQS
jgi:hypothetical protein